MYNYKFEKFIYISLKMEAEKFKKLYEALSEFDENVLEAYEQVKLLFKRFIFLENEIKDKKDIWFEKDEIRKDSEYYEIINDIIKI